MKASYLMILLSLTLIGCGKSGSEGKSTTTISLKEGEDLSTYLSQLSLDSNAPEGVGTLFSLKKDIYEDKISLCTWFLVAPNKAMTNSHCIPESLKKNKSLNCSKLLQGKIQTERGVKTASCKKLIYSSEISTDVTNNNDYALMEINESIGNAESFNLKRYGVSEGETLSVLTMTHHQTSSGIYSEFKKHNCMMKSSDYFGVISSAGASPLTGFLAEGSSGVCKTVSGNSGSPVVNNNGELIGILHGGLVDSYDGSRGFTKNLSIITNLRCQKFGDAQMDQGYPTTCYQEKRINKMDKEAEIKKIKALTNAELKKLMMKQPGYLEYKTKEDVTGEATIVLFEPTCVKPVSGWTEKDLMTIKKAGEVQYVYPTVSQYEMTLELDYYGNLAMVSKASGMVEFRIRDLKMLGLGNVEIESMYYLGRASTRYNKNIEMCKTL